jgi:hypothetical protein
MDMMAAFYEMPEVDQRRIQMMAAFYAMAPEQQRRFLACAGGCYCVKRGGDGLYWAGGDRWVEDWRHARQFRGPGDPWQEAADDAKAAGGQVVFIETQLRPRLRMPGT